MKPSITLPALLLAMAALNGAAAGFAAFYVDASASACSDTGPGTETQPWCSNPHGVLTTDRTPIDGPDADNRALVGRNNVIHTTVGYSINGAIDPNRLWVNNTHAHIATDPDARGGTLPRNSGSVTTGSAGAVAANNVTEGHLGCSYGSGCHHIYETDPYPFAGDFELQAGQAAVGGADPALAPATDQLGRARHGAPDAGAREFQSITPIGQIYIAMPTAGTDANPIIHQDFASNDRFFLNGTHDIILRRGSFRPATEPHGSSQIKAWTVNGVLHQPDDILLEDIVMENFHDPNEGHPGGPIHVMSGTDLTFRRVMLDHGEIYAIEFTRFQGDTPERVLIEDSWLGGGFQTGVSILLGAGHGESYRNYTVRNVTGAGSLQCGAAPFDAATIIVEDSRFDRLTGCNGKATFTNVVVRQNCCGNVLPAGVTINPNVDLSKKLPGEPPPSPPPPPPPPPPAGYHPACEPTCDQQIADLEAQRAQLQAGLAARTAELEACRAKLVQVNAIRHDSGSNGSKLNRIHTVIHEGGLCAGFSP
jgi:hypothetical protein